MLRVEDLHVSYGSSRVLFGVSFEVGAGEAVALLGRNGVGKTTTLRGIAGWTAPQSGRVVWEGEHVTGMPVHRIARLGIGLVPEDRRIFADLTVRENLDIARRQTGGEEWSEERVCELFPDLQDLAERRGGALSGGQQQMLAIGRCLMGNPRLLLLDEPSEGLAPRVVEDLEAQIGRLKEGGLSIVLAEQNLDFALALSDRVHILEKGEIKYSGTAGALRDDAEAQKSYLAF